MLKFVAILLGMGLVANSAIAMTEGTAQVDANGDGVMTIDEVQAVFPDVTADAFAEADADNDGALTDEEMDPAVQVAVAMPVAMPEDLRSNNAVMALAALTEPTMPTPRVIMSDQPTDILTAYAAASPAADPGAQRALEMIIEGTSTASAAGAPPTPTDRLPVLPPLRPSASIQTASLGGNLSDLFGSTFGATDASAPAPLAEALVQHVAARPDPDAMRRPNLVAPDLEHVADIFTDPAAMSSGRYAVIFDHDEADFDPTPEMGRHVLVKGVGDSDPAPVHTRFTRTAPLVLASN